ncbi:hypothetical protein VPHD528_0076 [Vibrio phage D528]
MNGMTDIGNVGQIGAFIILVVALLAGVYCYMLSKSRLKRARQPELTALVGLKQGERLPVVRVKFIRRRDFEDGVYEIDAEDANGTHLTINFPLPVAANYGETLTLHNLYVYDVDDVWLSDKPWML